MDVHSLSRVLHSFKKAGYLDLAPMQAVSLLVCRTRPSEAGPIDIALIAGVHVRSKTCSPAVVDWVWDAVQNVKRGKWGTQEVISAPQILN